MRSRAQKTYETCELLADDETWSGILEPAFCENPNAAESLAHLLFTLKEAIDGGPTGARRASLTLLDGIKQVYLQTDAHKASLKLYLLSLTGHLKPQDEPLTLINGSLERGTIEIARISATKPRRKRTTKSRR